MSRKLRGLSLLAGIGCLVFAGSASAATESLAGTVANGSCTVARTIFVPGPTRIEVSLSTTAQNPTDGRAELVNSNGGRVVGTGGMVAYDTPGAGQYVIRACVTYEEQNPPNIQFTGLLGTGPAGKPVLASSGDTTGSQTKPKYAGPNVSGRAAVKTRSGLAWFTATTASNSKVTLRVFDPIHHRTRVVKGLTAINSGRTLQLSGHALRFVLDRRLGTVRYVSSSFAVNGKVVQGGFQITA